MSDKKEPPKRAFEIHIKVGGNTKEDALVLLNEFVDQLERGGTGCASGSPSCGGFYDVKTNPEQTQEKYFEDLVKYNGT